MAVVAGMKKPNDHAEPTKVERWKKHTKKQKNFYIVQAIRCSQVYCIRSNKIVLKELFHDYIHILHDL